MKKGGLYIIAIILVLALSGCNFSPSSDSDKFYVEITYDGEIMEYFELTDEVDRQIDLDYEGHNVLVIKDGHVDMIEADCPDQDCVHMKAITYDSWNPAIICAPNGIVVRIIGVENELDGIV